MTDEKKYKHEWYLRHRETAKARSKIRREQHREEIKKYMHEWHKKHPLMSKYRGMLVRCGYGKYKSKNRKWYAGKGIKVCEEWRKSYATFEAWALSHGWKKGLHIDRIDGTKDYSPDNCRFVTCKENQRNRSSNLIVSYNGKKMSLAEAVERSGTKIAYRTIHHRIKLYGWSFNEALNTPVRKKGEKNAQGIR